MPVPGSLIVEQAIELSPDLILFGAGHVTESALVPRQDGRGRRFRLAVVEIEISPAAGIGEPF